MFCPNCGNKVEATMIFCDKCGCRLETSVENTLVPQTTSNAIIANNTQQEQVIKNQKPLIKKDTLINVTLSLLLIAIYAGISVIFILLFNIKDTVAIETIYDKSQPFCITLKEYLDFLMNGNRIFNPTFISSMITISTYLLVYSVPVFAFFGILATIFRKKQVSFNVAFSVITAMSSVAIAIVTPLSTILIPELTQAISINAGVIFQDIKQITSTALILLSIVSIILLIASMIISIILSKRRSR